MFAIVKEFVINKRQKFWHVDILYDLIVLLHLVHSNPNHTHELHTAARIFSAVYMCILSCRVARA